VSTTDQVNILMVDDQPAKLLSYEAILADLGLNLIKATSGREALDMVSYQAPMEQSEPVIKLSPGE
jgi:CheY-like chemotaxis protein